MYLSSTNVWKHLFKLREQLSVSEVGLAGEDVTPTQEVMGLEAVPAKEAGEIVEADDETPGKVVEFLKSAKVI